MWVLLVKSVLAGTPVALDSVPALCTASLEKRWPGAAVLETEREASGDLEFEIRTTSGELLEVEMTQEGVVSEVEVETSRSLVVADLPEAVRSALLERWEGATLVEVEQEEALFEVEILTRSGAQLEVVLTNAGVIASFKVDDDGDKP